MGPKKEEGHTFPGSLWQYVTEGPKTMVPAKAAAVPYISKWLGL